jgi:hypothetical protein
MFRGGFNSGTYWLPVGDDAVPSGTSASAAGGPFVISSSDYAITGKATKLNVRVAITVNGTAPGQSFTIGLYPISSVGGTNNNHSITLGTVVSGSTVAFTSGTLTSNSIHVANSGDFNLPTDGNYVLGAVVGGNVSNNPFVGVTAELRVRNV